MLGECSTRFHLEMLPLGMPYLKDVPCMGLVRKLLNILNRCKKMVYSPNDITFICLLSSWSHAGLVDEGMHCFPLKSTVYGISTKLEHYTCIVDLLGHASHLQKAENMVMAMPCKPHVAVWKALLGACRIHGNMELAECIAK
jgi:hypothetical protein